MCNHQQGVFFHPYICYSLKQNWRVINHGHLSYGYCGEKNVLHTLYHVHKKFSPCNHTPSARRQKTMQVAIMNSNKLPKVRKK